MSITSPALRERLRLARWRPIVCGEHVMEYIVAIRCERELKIVEFGVQPDDGPEIDDIWIVPLEEDGRPTRDTLVGFLPYADDCSPFDLLEEFHYSAAAGVVRLRTMLRIYALDVAQVDPKELAEMCELVREIHRDGRFRCAGL